MDEYGISGEEAKELLVGMCEYLGCEGFCPRGVCDAEEEDCLGAG